MSNTTETIQQLAEMCSAVSTQMAESSTPKRKTPNYGTETEKIVHEMLVENTGADICDSGGAYGRNWEEAREIGNFWNIKSTIYSKEDYVTKHVFHILTDVLYYEKEMDEKFQKFAKTGKMAGKSRDETIEEFCAEFGEGNRMSSGTENEEFSLCNQALYYDTVKIDGTTYVILQIHGGCDLRGGYTRPRVFSMQEQETLANAITDASLRCDCGEVSTINGNDWEPSNGDTPNPEYSWEDGLCEDWDWKKDGKLHCSKCNCTIK